MKMSETNDLTRGSFDQALSSLMNGASAYGEYFKNLEETLYSAEDEQPDRGLPNYIGVTSSHGGEGVSTVAVNLAKVLAISREEQVLLADANYLKPAIHTEFQIAQAPGLGEAIWEDADLELVIRPTPKENLFVLPAGAVNRGPFQFDPRRFPAVYQALTAKFHHIVFDLPPAGESSAVLKLASHLDGIILTVQAERVRYEVAKKTKERLKVAGANILGGVLNRRKYHIPEWLYRTL
ncbi:MAG: P-loop NTPase [Candidatus Marinimicrobia bacterium]|nr:P-loop NTPase [Candidatus Neomarinimicrobiota bacterium]